MRDIKSYFEMSRIQQADIEHITKNYIKLTVIEQEGIAYEVNELTTALKHIQSLKYADREALVEAIEDSEKLTGGK